MTSQTDLRTAIEYTTKHFLAAYKDAGEANDPSIINRDVTRDCKRYFPPVGVMKLFGAPVGVALDNAAYEAGMAKDMTKSTVTGTGISNLTIDTETRKAAVTTMTYVKYHDGKWQ